MQIKISSTSDINAKKSQNQIVGAGDIKDFKREFSLLIFILLGNYLLVDLSTLKFSEYKLSFSSLLSLFTLLITGFSSLS